MLLDGGEDDSLFHAPMLQEGDDSPGDINDTDTDLGEDAMVIDQLNPVPEIGQIEQNHVRRMIALDPN